MTIEEALLRNRKIHKFSEWRATICSKNPFFGHIERFVKFCPRGRCAEADALTRARDDRATGPRLSPVDSATHRPWTWTRRGIQHRSRLPNLNYVSRRSFTQVAKFIRYVL